MPLAEVVKVLADPKCVLEELAGHLAQPELPDETVRLQDEMARIDEQQRRLTRLFVAGELPEELLRTEAERLQAELLSGVK